MLKEVEMTPGFKLGVIGRKSFFSTSRTRKGGSFGKVDIDVEAPFGNVKFASF